MTENDQPTPDQPTPDQPTPDQPTPDQPTPDQPTQSEQSRPQGRRGFRLAFGVVAVIHAVLLLLQPVLAGLSLQGSMIALDAHVMNGMAVMTVALIQIIAAILWFKPGGGPSRAIGASVFLFVLELVQFAVGDAGGYAIHLPLGLILLAGAGMMPRLAFANSSPRTRGTTRRSRTTAAGEVR